MAEEIFLVNPGTGERTRLEGVESVRYDPGIDAAVEAFASFSVSLGRALESMREIALSFSYAVNESLAPMVAAIWREFGRTQRKPTPWHYKKARVRLRREGLPTSGIEARARKLRMG